MRRRLVDLLVCPLYGTPLELIEWEGRTIALTDEQTAAAQRRGIDATALAWDVVTGVLVNRPRQIYYPILRGIPRLLVFPTAIDREFEAAHGERLRVELPGYTLPNGSSMPGEVNVLRSFSSEWVNYGWRKEAYWDVSADNMGRSMRYMLDLDRYTIRDALVLEVGIGVGGIADFITRTDHCEIVGIDLSFAVDVAGREFGGNPFLHVIQASLFAPPFRDETFDLVYSHGVIHHTHSTRAAFERIARLSRPGGRLYVWVYNPDEETRTLRRRAVMAVESAIRPVCSRLPARLQVGLLLPIIVLYLIYENWLRRDGRGVRYGWREAVHAARDRLTPPFVHRHHITEVRAWFRAAGYDEIGSADTGQAPEFVPDNFLRQTAMQGVRRAGVAAGSAADSLHVSAG